jgi:hypothetical protein
MFGACVTSVEGEPEESVDEVESAIELEAEPFPICPDLVFRLQYSQECWTPRGNGTRQCTDTITQHRGPVFKVTGIECKTINTTVSTSCGLCVVIDLPGDEPGDELPF